MNLNGEINTWDAHDFDGYAFGRYGFCTFP